MYLFLRWNRPFDSHTVVSLVSLSKPALRIFIANYILAGGR